MAGKTISRYIWQVASAPGDYPDIRYVVYPTRRDGTLIGTKPRMRHDLECGGGHFEWGDGVLLGTPVLATDEQLRTLPACQHCADRRDGLKGNPSRRSEGRLGDICASCHQVMPVTGVCDNCA